MTTLIITFVVITVLFVTLAVFGMVKKSDEKIEKMLEERQRHADEVIENLLRKKHEK